MINEKNEFLTGSWLSGLTFCKDLRDVCVWVGGPDTLTQWPRKTANFCSQGLKTQEVQCNAVPTWVCVYTDWALSRTKNLTGID